MTKIEWEEVYSTLSSYKQRFMRVYPINDNNRSSVNARDIIDIMHNTKNYINSIEELSELYYYGANSGTARYMAEGFLMEASDFIGAITTLIAKVRIKIEA